MRHREGLVHYVARGRRWCLKARVERCVDKWMVNAIGALETSLLVLREGMQRAAERVAGEGVEVAVKDTGPRCGAG